MNAAQLRKLREREGELVQRAEELIEKSRIWENREFGLSQISLLKNIANTTSAIEVLLNFIRYQIGRDSRKWNHQRFGDLLLEDLNKISSDTRGWNGADDSVSELTLRQARMFIGYAGRYLKYKKEMARNA